MLLPLVAGAIGAAYGAASGVAAHVALRRPVAAATPVLGAVAGGLAALGFAAAAGWPKVLLCGAIGALPALVLGLAARRGIAFALGAFATAIGGAFYVLAPRAGSADESMAPWLAAFGLLLVIALSWYLTLRVIRLEEPLR